MSFLTRFISGKRKLLGVTLAGGIGSVIAGRMAYQSHSQRHVSRRASPSYLEFDDSDLESDEAIWALYERWRRHHKMERWRSREEMERRFQRFKDYAVENNQLLKDLNNLKRDYPALALAFPEEKTPRRPRLPRTADLPSLEKGLYGGCPDQYDPEEHPRKWNSVLRNSPNLRDVAEFYPEPPAADAAAATSRCAWCCD